MGDRGREGSVRATEGESCSAPVETADSVEAGKDGRRLAVRGERAVERSVERRRVALGRRERPEADGAVADRADDGLDEEQEADLVDRNAAHCREERTSQLEHEHEVSNVERDDAPGVWIAQYRRKPPSCCVVMPRSAGRVLSMRRYEGQMAPRSWAAILPAR